MAQGLRDELEDACALGDRHAERLLRRTMVLRPKRKDGDAAIQRIRWTSARCFGWTSETNRRWFHGIK